MRKVLHAKTKIFTRIRFAGRKVSSDKVEVFFASVYCNKTCFATFYNCLEQASFCNPPSRMLGPDGVSQFGRDQLPNALIGCLTAAAGRIGQRVKCLASVFVVASGRDGVIKYNIFRSNHGEGNCKLSAKTVKQRRGVGRSVGHRLQGTALGVTLVVAEGAVIVVKFQPNHRLLVLTSVLVIVVVVIVVVRVEKG